MSTSLLTLARNIAKDGYGYATGAPSSTGLTTTIVDTSADSPLDTGDSTTLWVNAWAKITADSAGTPQNVGEVQRITTYAPSTGTLTVGRAFSETTKTTMTYDLYMGIPPTRKGLIKGTDEFINAVLRRLFYHRPFLLTLITDGDMETSGVSNWTASNSAATKSTSTGVTLGDQALRVLNSSASGYVQSASVNVEESQFLYLAADLTVVTGTGTLQLYDVTNSASIETAESSEKQSRRVWLSANVPADCKQVAVRLVGTGASDDCYWDNVTLLNSSATEMPLPSWYVERKWMERLGMWVARSGASSGDHSALDSIDRYPLQFWPIEDPTGYTPFKVKFDSYVLSGAHLVGEALSPFSELSADTDTTDANADLVKAFALVDIAQERKNKDLLQIWGPKAEALDKLYQAQWRGPQRFKFRTPY